MGSIPVLEGSPTPFREGTGNPLHYFCLDRGAWWAGVHGFANSGYDSGTEHTRIKTEKVGAEVTENLECQAEYKNGVTGRIGLRQDETALF